MRLQNERQTFGKQRFESVMVGDIAAGGGGDTAHGVPFVVYEPGGEERADGGTADSDG